MSKEDLDKGETADEPFLNEVIAKPEIDELLEPKVFVNAKRYDADGEHEVDSFTDWKSVMLARLNWSNWIRLTILEAIHLNIMTTLIMLHG